MVPVTAWTRCCNGIAMCMASISVGMVSPVWAESLRVFGPQDSPPSLERREGRIQGLLFDVLKAAEPITGDTYNFEAGPWARMAAQAAAGEGAIVGFSRNEEREKLYDYSAPLCFEDLGLVVLKSRAFKYKALEDLRGKTVSAAIGTSFGREVDAAIDSGLFKVDREVSQTGRMRKVLAGWSDATIVGNGQYGFKSALAESGLGQDDLQRLMLLPVPLTQDPLHLAFLKTMGKRDALDRLNAALPKIKKLGWMCQLEKSPSYARK